MFTEKVFILIHFLHRHRLYLSIKELWTCKLSCFICVLNIHEQLLILMFSKWSFTCHSDGKWIIFYRHRTWCTDGHLWESPLWLPQAHFWTLVVLKLFMFHVSGLQISIQTDPVKPAPPPPGPKILKNKALLCRPLVQNKGVSCKTQTADCEVQTGKATHTHTHTSR